MTFDEMSLEDIANELSQAEIQALQYLKSQGFLASVREKMEEIAPSQEDIVSQYSRNQYVEQTVEVIKGLTATFRTITPQAMDESLAFANKERGAVQENGPRILARRRLSHALVEINEKHIGKMPIEGSYFQLMAADPKNFKERMFERAESVYEFLLVYGLTDKLCEAFGVWEAIIYDRLNGIEDVQGVIKNSTRGSASAQ